MMLLYRLGHAFFAHAADMISTREVLDYFDFDDRYDFSLFREAEMRDMLYITIFAALRELYLFARCNTLFYLMLY